GQILKSWPVPDDPLWSAGRPSAVRGFTADGQSLILQGGVVAVWDIQTAKPRTSWSLLRKKVVVESSAKGRSDPEIKSVAVTSDGSQIAFALRKITTFGDKQFQFGGKGPGGKGPIGARGRPGQVQGGRLMILETRTGKLTYQTD